MIGMINFLSLATEANTNETDTPQVDNSSKLRKSFSVINLFISGVSSMMGSGIYVIPGTIAQNTTDMRWALLTWSVGGIIAGLTFCELNKKNKKKQAARKFISLRRMDTLWIFQLVGRPYFSVYQSVMPTTLFLLANTLLSDSKDKQETAAKLVTVACILVIATVNCLSVSYYKKLQTFFMVEHVFGSVFLIGLGVWQVTKRETSNFREVFNTTPTRHWRLLATLVLLRTAALSILKVRE